MPNLCNKIGDLYVVTTPIGNMEDITLRALKTLGQVDLVAAEDTRHTGRLLAYHDIKNNLISYHEHNEEARTPVLIHRLKTGSSVALVTNAGTPAVSDPGYRLVKAAIANDIRVIPIPGVSAVITAISAAGLPTDSFIFSGFPARKKSKRIEQLKALAKENRTLIFYESPGRILTLMEEIINVMGDRYCVLCREMTKLHEEFLRGILSEIMNILRERPAVKGECTLLVKGCEENNEVSPDVVRAELIKGLAENGSKLSEVSKTVAQKYGLPKNKVYEAALKLKRKVDSA
ncbi:MAG: 16S rRNA (cytidine(1402)-2'-O)-methyltransferase [Desulfobacterales bacterium]|jgi:16S rRNA (cytidine1402-2'-O)-methyltransferase